MTVWPEKIFVADFIFGMTSSLIHRKANSRFWATLGDFGVRRLVFSSLKRDACSAVLGSQFCSSVRLSLTCVLCNETKEHIVDILIPHERTITLVFSTDKDCRATFSFTEIWALKVTHPFEKRLRPITFYNVSTVRASEKSSIIANKQSTITVALPAFQRAIDEVCKLLPTPSKGG